MSMTQAQFTEAVLKLPAEKRIALTQISANAANGSMWGMVSENILSDNFEAITKSGNYLVYKIDDRYLLVANPQVFIESLAEVNKEMSQNMAKKYSEGKENAFTNFNKRIKTLVSRAKKGEKRHPIGIYSINATPTATAPNGERVNAYQLTFGQLGALLAEASKTYGCKFKVELAENAVVQNVASVPSGMDLSGVQMCRDDNAMLVTLLID